jgi:beta-glucosidase
MGRKGTKVGPAENMPTAVPLIDSPEHVKAAEAATRDLNVHFLGPMLDGKYSDAFLKAAGKDAPKFTDADLRVIAAPLDFVGINVYIPTLLVMASDQPPGYRQVPFNVSHPKMFSAWHRLEPEVLYWAPRLLHSIWKPKEIYITENGCAASDELAADGNVYDSDRLMYLRTGMAHLQRATADGVPVKGNFVWCAMDNFEWTKGTARALAWFTWTSRPRSARRSSAPPGSRRRRGVTRWCSVTDHDAPR